MVNKEAILGMTLEQLVLFGVLCAVGYRIIRWFRDAKLTPDPWGPEVEREVQDAEARELCHRCLTPQPERGWFCEHCGASIGPYNNYMPYVDVFAQGEVLRAGTRDHLRPSFFIILGYVIVSLAMYSIFAPIYLFFVIRHLHGQNEQSNDEVVQV